MKNRASGQLLFLEAWNLKTRDHQTVLIQPRKNQGIYMGLSATL
jgi:hypothetical protein